MSEVKKATPEQLQRLTDLQQQWDQLTKRFGELHFQKKLVGQELDEIDAALDTLEVNRRAAVQELEAAFGSTGTINLKTGEFTPE